MTRGTEFSTPPPLQGLPQPPAHKTRDVTGNHAVSHQGSVNGVRIKKAFLYRLLPQSPTKMKRQFTVPRCLPSGTLGGNSPPSAGGKKTQGESLEKLVLGSLADFLSA